MWVQVHASKAQGPDAAPTAKPKTGARDLLTQAHQQEAGQEEEAGQPMSASTQGLAATADAFSMRQVAPGGMLQQPAWLQLQQQQQQQQQSARQLAQGEQFAGRAEAGGAVPLHLSAGSGQLQSRQSGLQAAVSGQLPSRQSAQQRSDQQSLRSWQLHSRPSGQQHSELQSHGSGQFQTEASGVQSSGSEQMQSRQSGPRLTGQVQSGLQSHASGQLRSDLESLGSGMMQPGQLQTGQLSEAVRQQLARINALQAAERQMHDQKKAFTDKQQQQQQQPIQQASTPAAASQADSQPLTSTLPQQLPADLSLMGTGLPQHKAGVTSLQRAQLLIREQQLKGMHLPSRASRQGLAHGNMPGTSLGVHPSDVPGDTMLSGLDRHASSSTASDLQAPRRAIAPSAARDPKSASWGQLGGPSSASLPAASLSRLPQSLEGGLTAAPHSGSSPRLCLPLARAKSQSPSPASSLGQSHPLGFSSSQMLPPASSPRKSQSPHLTTGKSPTVAPAPQLGLQSLPGPSPALSPTLGLAAAEGELQAAQARLAAEGPR